MFPDSISGVTRVNNSDGNSEVFPVVTSYDVALSLNYITLIGVADSSQIGEYLGFCEDSLIAVYL